jgi:hypothetical protein
MSKSRSITLAGTAMEVPMLPIRYNRVAFPLCRKLHNAGFLDRVVEGMGNVDCSTEEMDDLIEIAFAAAQAANPRITREEFDNWPITPPELVDAFFLVRYQTGGWVELTGPAPEGEDVPGEAQGAETLLI